jgi:dienelactone hydrolase
MRDAAQAQGAAVTLTTYPGARHSFSGYWWTAATRASWHDCAQFLSNVRRDRYSGSM